MTTKSEFYGKLRVVVRKKEAAHGEDHAPLGSRR
jgi:hypothetical protein